MNNFVGASSTELGMHRKHAFTLVELLVIIAIIVVLAALLLPVSSNAKSRAQRASCVNNLRQINLGVRIYSDESSDAAPQLANGQPVWFRYRELLQSYMGLKNPPSLRDKVFACPADTFYYKLTPQFNMQYVPKGAYTESNGLYSSYGFNGGNAATNVSWVAGVETLPGISGRKLSTIKHPARTVLVAEGTAFGPYSWHQPRPAKTQPDGTLLPFFNDARNVVSFVDGHVSYINIYWNSSTNSLGFLTFTFFYDPPAEYDYQWSGD